MTPYPKCLLHFAFGQNLTLAKSFFSLREKPVSLAHKPMKELPSNITVSQTGEGVQIDLPSRPSLRVKFFGLFLTLFSLLFMAIPMGVGFLFLFHSSEGDVPFVIFLLLFLFLMVGFVFFSIALSILLGKDRIVLTPTKLIVERHLGPIRWRRNLPLSNLRYLQYGSGNIQVDGQNLFSGSLPKDFGWLAAALTNRRPKALLFGYPLEWIQPLTKFLREKIQEFQQKSVPVFQSEKQQVIQVEEAEVLQPPAGTKVRMEQWPGGVRLTVPPLGLFKGTKGFFFFSLVWLGFISIFTAVFIFVPWDQKTNHNVWISFLIISLFWIFGIALLFYSIHMGKQRAMIQADSAGIRIAMASPFRKKVIAIPREEIRSITVGPSGMEINHVPVLELQIHRKNQDPVGLLAQLSDDELYWIASLLRHTLQLYPQRGPEKSESPQLDMSIQDKGIVG